MVLRGPTQSTAANQQDARGVRETRVPTRRGKGAQEITFKKGGATSLGHVVVASYKERVATYFCNLYVTSRASSMASGCKCDCETSEAYCERIPPSARGQASRGAARYRYAARAPAHRRGTTPPITATARPPREARARARELRRRRGPGHPRPAKDIQNFGVARTTGLAKSRDALVCRETRRMDTRARTRTAHTCTFPDKPRTRAGTKGGG
jgi:hypothetical protein